jgi:anti-sigma factor RsiW
MTNDPKDRRLMGYLLGQLSEQERIEFEDRYFSDDALFEYLGAVETELIDAYARGELPERDRAQFEQRLLKSPRFRVRIAMAIQLHARASVTVATEAPAPESPKPAALPPPRPKPLMAAGRTTSPWIGAAAAVVAVVAAVTGWWVFQSSSPKAAPAPSETPAAAATPATVVTVSSSRPAAYEPPLTRDRLTVTPPGPVALVLAPASHESSALLTRTPGADYVRLQIDHDGPERERYAVIVSTRGRQRVWTEVNMAPRAQGAKGVILQIPADSLPAGDYLVTLSGGTLETRRLEPLADYSLRVR